MLLDIYSKNDASIIYPGLLASYLQVICRYVFSLLSKHPQGTIVINKLLYPLLTASHRCMLWTGTIVASNHRFNTRTWKPTVNNDRRVSITSY